jgi:hypothetical protein
MKDVIKAFLRRRGRIGDTNGARVSPSSDGGMTARARLNRPHFPQLEPSGINL